MTDTPNGHKATPEQWETLRRTSGSMYDDSCLCEVADTLAALEQRVQELEPQFTSEEAEMIAAPWSYITPSGKAPAPSAEPAPHPDDDAVDRFADAMKAKLARARERGRYGWQESSAEYLSEALRDHLAKGDPVDVANFAMMLHQNGQSIQPLATASAPAITLRRAIRQPMPPAAEPATDELPPKVGHILRLAEIIREVDGTHDKGAAALAEAILSHPGIAEVLPPAPAAGPAPAGSLVGVVAEALKDTQCESLAPRDIRRAYARAAIAAVAEWLEHGDRECEAVRLLRREAGR
jgi:hypothetical protein